MSDRDATAEEQDRVLRELAELGLAFARELKTQVGLVKSVGEADALALAFHRATRSVRLAIALQAKLARERHEVARLDRTAAARRTEARKEQIRTALSREIFTDEAEQEAAESLAERLDERLDEDALFEAFLVGPLEAAITRIRDDLGMPAEGEILPQREARSGGGGPRSGGGGFSRGAVGFNPLSQPAADSSPYGGASVSTPGAGGVTPSVSFADSSP
ncbi:hypothetical protein [Phenylobacterium sp.]|jgi:hypothetical protein|uniref:hypothetical protein n=1 Tax=Phenylobacterium sp. TaxID=1871053 RepID=UPI002F41FFB9